MVSVLLSIVSADSIVSKQISVRLEDDLYEGLKKGGYNQTDLINSLLRQFFDHDNVHHEETESFKMTIEEEITHILISCGINQVVWIKQGKQFNDSQVKLVSAKLKERGHLLSENRVSAALKDIKWK